MSTPASGSMFLFMVGSGVLASGTSMMNLYVEGNRNLEEDYLNLYIAGKAETNQLYLYYLLSDQLDTLSEEELYILLDGSSGVSPGFATPHSGNMNLFMTGHSEALEAANGGFFTPFGYFVGVPRSPSDFEDSLNLYLFGVATVSSDMDLYTHAVGSSSGSLNLFIRGYNPLQ